MTNTYVPAVLLGSAIGDAMGMPFEKLGVAIDPDLKTWDGTFEAGKYHKLPPGHWTDDTEMAMALARALIEKGEFDTETVVKSYLEWYKDNPTGMGGTVRQAMKNAEAFIFDKNNLPGVKAFSYDDQVGAGTVMRVAPLGVFYAEQPDMLRWVCKLDAYLTHIHEEAFAASLAVASLIAGAVRFRHPPSKFDTFGCDVGEPMTFMLDQLLVVEHTHTRRAVMAAAANRFLEPEEFADRFAGRWGNAWQIAATGIHCALRYWKDFNRGIIEAVKLGGDTDTRAAVTGAILGASHGQERLLEFISPRFSILREGGKVIDRDNDLWKARKRRP